MNKYTEADVNRTHKAMVEQLIYICIQNWKDVSDPLHAKMWDVGAAGLEGGREPDYFMHDMERILAQANMNKQEQNA